MDSTELYYIGMSLGQQGGNTGLAIIVTKIDYDKPTRKYFYKFQCTELKRFPAGMPFTEIAEQVDKIRHHIKLKDSCLVMDITGVGDPIAQLFRKFDPICLTFTGGYGIQQLGGSSFRIPLQDILASLRIAFETRRIKFAPGMELYDDMLLELESIEEGRTPSAGKGEQVLWRERPHDDLTFSIASVLWFTARDYRIPYIDENGKLPKAGGYEADEQAILDYDPYGR